MKISILSSFLATTLLLSCLFGCEGRQFQKEDKVTVSILPLKYLVDGITGGVLPVEILVPAGSSPETYEPTPRQMADLTKSGVVFTTGLIDFEKELFSKLASQNTDVNIIDVSSGIDLIAGSCTHTHKGHSHSHSHGVDPHIWMSPKELVIMAENIYQGITALYPDSIHYTNNYARLVDSLHKLDNEAGEMLSGMDIREFLIYHPALTYYARDYGLTQIALEDEGKEPSADHLKRLVDTAKQLGLRKIFYQKEFSRSVVEAIAKETGVEIIEIDPLAEDVYGNILHITELIAQ